jgi:hypothetical protein
MKLHIKRKEKIIFVILQFFFYIFPSCNIEKYVENRVLSISRFNKSNSTFATKNSIRGKILSKSCPILVYQILGFRPNELYLMVLFSFCKNINNSPF